MADLLWMVAGLGAASAPLAAGFAMTLVRRRRLRVARTAFAANHGASEYHLSPTIEDAERNLAVLLRRMQAHLQDPYNFTASRIVGEAAFEECLDRAAALGTRIAELGGAASTDPAEHERTRGLILEGLMTRHRMAAIGSLRPPKTGGTTAPSPMQAAN